MIDPVETVSPSLLDAWLNVLGAFHPLIVHFPIALAIVAALAMLWNWIWQHDGFGEFAFHCTWIAALASVFVAASGWFFVDPDQKITSWDSLLDSILTVFPAALAWFSGKADQSQTLNLHRWVGIGSSAGLIALTFMTSLVRSDSWPGLLKISRITSLVVATAIGITAHFGGDMVWGEGQVTTPLSAALSASWTAVVGNHDQVHATEIAPPPVIAPLTPVVPATSTAPATEPATGPATAPSTAPATEPTTAPTSVPATAPSTLPLTPATTDAPKPIANTFFNNAFGFSSMLAVAVLQTTPPSTPPAAAQTAPTAPTAPTTTPAVTPAATPMEIPKDLEYNKNILPILEARCWDCHGKGVAKGGVAFDHVAELIVKEPLVKSKQVPIILAGKPASSAMMKAIQKPMTAKGHMPPKGARLMADQIALIEAWIQQGAKVVNPPKP